MDLTETQTLWKAALEHCLLLVWMNELGFDELTMMVPAPLPQLMDKEAGSVCVCMQYMHARVRMQELADLIS